MRGSLPHTMPLSPIGRGKYKVSADVRFAGVGQQVEEHHERVKLK